MQFIGSILEEYLENEFDIFVIGGGINGCGIARDAVGRGYSVCLAEMNDLASGTSSWSSKLDVTRNCAAPLTAYYALKENIYGKQTNSRI